MNAAALINKRFEGRDEEILDPSIPIIDAHHHFYDRPNLRYMFDDFLADATAGHRVVASVYIETKEMARIDGPELLRPLGEVEFANGMGAMGASGRYGPCKVAAAIVGNADLARGKAAAELLDRAIAAAPDRFRGVRVTTLETDDASWMRYVIMPHRPVHGLLEDPIFHEGVRLLAPRGLSYDASVFHNQLLDLARFASKFDDTQMILGHMGMALALDKTPSERHEVFLEWKRDLVTLAKQPNVVCKIGGLGLPFWGLGLNERPDVITSTELASVWAPYVETAIEAFGPERCLMESNYPPDGRSCGYVPLWNALKKIVADCSEAERLAMFCGTAARIYRIDVSGLDHATQGTVEAWARS